MNGDTIEKEITKPIYKRWWVWLGIFFVIALVLFLLGNNFFNEKQGRMMQSDQTKTEISAPSANKQETRFTHQIFDPARISHIVPLGELNGGYVEAQAINGIAINIKRNSNAKADPVDIFAPTDMTLEDYAYAPDPLASNRPVQWHLGFRISKEISLSFDHISWVTEEIKEVTPPTENSGYVPPIKKLSFKAGDLIAKTTGTEQANNFNIYLTDRNHINNFVNQARYEKVRLQYAYLNAACPFDYYEEGQKASYLALMGSEEAGRSNTCGTNSKDVKGSISGLWHLTKNGVGADYRGQYATPFSIYKNSANEIILYEINRKRYILSSSNPTFKDPAMVTASHCYNLTEWPDSRGTKGYVFFKIISDNEMQISYDAFGNCPASFPESNSITYYR